MQILSAMESTKNRKDCRSTAEILILRAMETPKHRKHYISQAEMRILSAMERSETQKTIQIRSEYTNFECHEKLQNTENATDPQRKFEF